MDERVNPIKLTNNKTGEVFELDFNRESLFVMDRDGFKIDEVTDYPATNIPKLFYYSFRKNHRKMTKTQTDSILQDVLHGVTPKMLERLILLYNQAATANNVQEEEDLEKNSDVTVEF
jgi:hypothetical protein